jgi:hypothetical protein
MGAPPSGISVRRKGIYSSRLLYSRGAAKLQNSKPGGVLDRVY